MRRHIAGRVIGFGIVAVVAVFVFGFAVMYLWNWLMPELFGLKAVTYWQAWGLLAMSWILFGGLRGHGRHWHGHHHWKHRMSERWMKMTPEEREKFKQEMRDHWHGWRHHHHHDDEPPTGNAA